MFTENFDREIATLESRIAILKASPVITYPISIQIEQLEGIVGMLEKLSHA